MARSKIKLPSAVFEETVNMGGIDIDFVHLDDGQRLITEDSLKKLFSIAENKEIHELLKNNWPKKHENR